MRAERERRHISLDAVARGTLVSQDYLELIDDDRLEDLPGGAYAKGFIRSYVAYLGLEPKPFLEAYDKRCGQPDPELSRFAQQGVRVPPAAHRRGWQVAVGSAGVMILLLALFGAFRSGDDPADMPSVAAAAARVPELSTGAAETVVRLEVIGQKTWVEAEIDGHTVFADTLEKGTFETFKADEDVVVFVARADAVRITANGQILSKPGPGAYRGVFNAKTTKLPANDTATSESSQAKTAAAR